jgi:hypothetical protein
MLNELEKAKIDPINVSKAIKTLLVEFTDINPNKLYTADKDKLSNNTLLEKAFPAKLIDICREYNSREY